MNYLPSVIILILSVTFVTSPAFTDPFTGFRPDQLPVYDPQPPIQPAGYAFAIWGVIYLWLVVSAVFGVWKRRTDPQWNAVRLPLGVALAVGTPWLAIANASAIWATITIFIMALAAIAAFLRAPYQDHWFLKTPIGIFSGWLTAASFVSLGATVSGYGVIPPIPMAFIGILAALGVAVWVQKRAPRAPAYGFTVMWALTAIIVVNMPQTISVALIAGLGIVALALTLILRRPTI